jgi:hypothetical protein
MMTAIAVVESTNPEQNQNTIPEVQGNKLLTRSGQSNYLAGFVA